MSATFRIIYETTSTLGAYYVSIIGKITSIEASINFEILREISLDINLLLSYCRYSKNYALDNPISKAQCPYFGH